MKNNKINSLNLKILFFIVLIYSTVFIFMINSSVFEFKSICEKCKKDKKESESEPNEKLSLPKNIGEFIKIPVAEPPDSLATPCFGVPCSPSSTANCSKPAAP